MRMNEHEKDPQGCVRIPSDLEGAIVFPMPEISDEEAEAFERLAQAETTEEVMAALDEVIQVEGGHAITENSGPSCLLSEIDLASCSGVAELLRQALAEWECADETYGYEPPKWLVEAVDATYEE